MAARIWRRGIQAALGRGTKGANDCERTARQGVDQYLESAVQSRGCLIPADGWYEWVAVGKRKQPYYIQSNDGPPIFFAGLSSVKPERSDAAPTEHPGVVDGFVIVTDAAAGGMLDVHDRRPLVLTVEEARVWLDPDTTFEEAVHVANNARKVSEDFHWFPVTPNVNKSGGGNDSPVFNEPIASDEAESS